MTRLNSALIPIGGFFILLIWIFAAFVLTAFIHEFINYSIATYYGARATMHFGYFHTSCNRSVGLQCNGTYPTFAYTSFLPPSNESNYTYVEYGNYRKIVSLVQINENIDMQIFQFVVVFGLLYPIFGKKLRRHMRG